MIVNLFSMIKSRFVKNSVTIFIRTIFKTIYYTTINYKKSLKIGHNSNITNCTFGYNNSIYDNVVLSNVILGDYSYIGFNSNISNTTIGKFCSIGSNVKCGLGDHPSKIFVSTHPIFYSLKKQCGITFSDQNYFIEEKPILIGNDVWIGSNVVILGGVTIGDGAIIASGAVVTSDIPSFKIYGGIPAKHLKDRFTIEEVAFLNRIKWWERDLNWLKENFKLFHNIQDLIKFDLIEKH